MWLLSLFIIISKKAHIVNQKGENGMAFVGASEEEIQER